MITQAIAAVQAKNIQLARQLLKEFTGQNPNDERGWGWFYNVAENDSERLHFVKEVLRINPNNQRAKQLLERLRGSIPSSPEAGKSTREMARTRRKSAIWIAVICISVITVFFVILTNPTILAKIGGTGFLVLIIFYPLITKAFTSRIDKKLKEEKRAIRGAQAEEKIGRSLVGLGEDYHVLNDIESPYGNIDHIVFSRRNGIFLIETKAHGGKVRVEGDTLLVNDKLPEKDFIAQALKNSYWLKKEISKLIGPTPWITPVLVFTNAFVSPTKPIKGVRIVNKKYLTRILNSPGSQNATNAQVWEQRGKISRKLVTSSHLAIKSVHREDDS